jgi:hypothetical protein
MDVHAHFLMVEWPHAPGSPPMGQNALSCLGQLANPEVCVTFARMIEALPELSILIGHSFGDLFVQLLERV